MPAVVPQHAADPHLLGSPAKGGQPRVHDGSVGLVDFESAGTPRVWHLNPRAAMTPQALGAIFVALASTSLLMASAFWWAGAPLVLPFAGLEAGALGLAFLVHARQAGNSEEVQILGDELVLRQARRGVVSEARFPASRTRVRCGGATHGLIEISGPGACVLVGRQLPPARRRSACLSLRMALQAC